MRKMYKRIRNSSVAVVLTLCLLVCVLPAFADVDTGIGSEISGQARSVALYIQGRVGLYHGGWVDKQARYNADPVNQPEPAWDTETVINAKTGADRTSGLVYAESGMPASRKGTFTLKVTVPAKLGGAAAAAYVQRYLPMATASGSIVSMPVQRPLNSLGFSELINNLVKKDESPLLAPGYTMTFTQTGTIDFADGKGRISGVDDYTGNQMTVNDLTVKNGLAVEGSLQAASGAFSGAVTVNGLTTLNGGLVVKGDSGLEGPLLKLTNNGHSVVMEPESGRIAFKSDGDTPFYFNNDTNIDGVLRAKLNAGDLSAGYVPYERMKPNGTYDMHVTYADTLTPTNSGVHNLTVSNAQNASNALYAKSATRADHADAAGSLTDKALHAVTNRIKNEIGATVVSKWNDGTRYYRVYSDGFIEQGGFVGSWGLGGTYITFPKAFSSRVMTCGGNSRRDRGGDGGWDYVYDVSTSGFTFYHEQSNIGGFYWHATGY